MAKTRVVYLISQDQILVLDGKHVASFGFDQGQIVAGRICNQTQIVSSLGSYLQKEQLIGRAGLVFFTDDLLQAQLLSKKEVQIDLVSKLYLKTSVNTQLDYVATLEPGLWLQYQLLFWRLGVYVEFFTAEAVLHIKHLVPLLNLELSKISTLAQLKLMLDVHDSDLYLKMVHNLAKFKFD